MMRPINQYIMLRPTLPVPDNILDASLLGQHGQPGSKTRRHVRVEYTPVPIIMEMFRKMMVTEPTSYPSGESTSTGAPEAS